MVLEMVILLIKLDSIYYLSKRGMMTMDRISSFQKLSPQIFHISRNLFDRVDFTAGDCEWEGFCRYIGTVHKKIERERTDHDDGPGHSRRNAAMIECNSKVCITLNKVD